MMPKQLFKILSYTIFFVIMGGITVFLGLRVSLPYLINHKEKLTAIATYLVGQPVNIGTAQVTWQKAEPVFLFKNVTLYDQSQNRVILQAKSIKVGIHLLNSLLHLQIRRGLYEISGVQLTLSQPLESWNFIFSSNLSLEETVASQSLLNTIANTHYWWKWLFNQDQIILKDMHILLKHQNGQIFPLSNIELSLYNRHQKWYLSGQTTFPANVSSFPLEFKAVLKGVPEDLQSWQGQIYIKLKKLNLASWFPAWYEQASNYVVLKKANKLYQVINIYFLNSKINQGIKCFSDSLLCENGHFLWQVTLNELSLPERLQEKVKIINATKITNRFQISQGDLTGELWFNLRQGRFLNAQAMIQAEQLGITRTKDYQTKIIDNLAAHIVWLSQEKGWELIGDDIHITSTEGAWPSTKFILKSETTEVGRNWLFSIETLDLKHLWPWLHYLLPDQHSFLEHINSNQLQGIIQQLIYHRLPDHSWQTKAHVQVKMIASKNFFFGPFDLHLELSPQQGIINLQGQNILLNSPNIFRKSLAIKNFLLPLTYQRSLDNQWHVSAPSFTIYNNDLRLNGEASLVFDKAGWLNPLVKLNAHGDVLNLQHIADYLPVKHSAQALRSWLDTAITGGKEGEITTFLQGRILDFPFINKKGLFLLKMAAKNVNLQFDKEWPALQDLVGQLEFRNETLSVNVMQGSIAGIPIQNYKIFIPRIGDHLETLQIQGQTITTVDKAAQLVLKSPLKKDYAFLNTLNLQGPITVDLDLAFPFYRNGERKIKGHIYFNQVELTHPRVPFKINNIEGDLFFNKKNFSSQNLKLTSFNLPYQAEIATSPQNLVIKIQGLFVPEKVFSAFKLKAFNFVNGASNGMVQLLFNPRDRLQSIRISSTLQGISSSLPFPLNKKANEKKILNLIFNFKNSIIETLVNLDNLQIKILPLSTEWQLRIMNPAMAGTLLVKTQAPYAIEGIFSYLKIKKQPEATAMSLLTPKSIPPLHLTIEDFYYDQQSLGKVRLATSPHNTGLQIQQLLLENPFYQIATTGKWSTSPNKTILKGVFYSAALGKFLQSQGITPAIDSPSAKAEFEFSSPLSPLKWRLDQINGTIYLQLQQGSISHLGPNVEAKVGLGKLLSILSLQTLPRHLVLDFSDIAGKGFTFDKISGHFSLKNGYLETSDTHMDGSLAYAKIQGRIGLNQRNYDLILKVSPHITASLPLVATIAGGPIAGIATWFADKVLSHAMRNVSSYTYRVTGPWANPQVEPINITQINHQSHIKLKSLMQ